MADKVKHHILCIDDDEDIRNLAKPIKKVKLLDFINNLAETGNVG